jgi:Domain of unknown function (DUF2019)
MKGGSPAGPSKEDVKSLIEEYVQAAILYGQALSAAEHKKANKQHSRVTKVYQKLMSTGTDAQRALLELLEHPEVSVRCWAAAHALNFAPERGETMLSKIAADGPMPLSMTAETVLLGWRSRTL